MKRENRTILFGFSYRRENNLILRIRIKVNVVLITKSDNTYWIVILVRKGE